MRRWLSEGRVSSDSLVWREGWTDWQHAGKLFPALENRVRDPRWPDTYIGVITQPLQFSAFNKSDPNVTAYPAEIDGAWPDCVAAANLVLAAPSPLTPANHYCVKTLRPAWFQEQKIVAREGNHVFLQL